MAVSSHGCLKPEPLITLNHMLDLLTTAILLCLIIGVATLAVSQLLKPLPRAAAQYLMLRRWHRQADLGEGVSAPIWLTDWVNERRADKKLVESDRQHKFPKASFRHLARSISNGHFMKILQSASTLILARPSLAVGEFHMLTAGASSEDRGTILLLDRLARTSPHLVAELMNPKPPEPKPPESDSSEPWDEREISADKPEETLDSTGFAEVVAAAQDAVSAATERCLDQIQLRLDSAVAAYSRLLTMLIGIVIAQAAAMAVSGRYSWAAAVVGIVGGLLASLAYDAAGNYFSRRR